MRERIKKLISGQMNVPYIVCKAGYAEGAETLKPKRVMTPKPFNPVIKLRRSEFKKVS